MQSQGVWNAEEDDGFTGPARRQVAPKKAAPKFQYGIDDILRLLLREWWLMLIVFATILGLGVAFSMTLSKSYTADASLLMQLGQDYVYVPHAGDAARGAIATIDEVVQSEVEILNSAELKHRTIEKLGYHAIVPSIPASFVPRTAAQKEQADAQAMKVLGGLKTATAPQSNIVRLEFKHENAQSAALILNTLIDIYQKYRHEVFSDVTAPLLEHQKEAFDRRLHEADKSYEDFLLRNGVGDFVAAKATYSKLYDTITSEIYVADAGIATASSRLAAVNARLRQQAPEMSTERQLDLSVPSKILALRQQREDLLVRYTPNAQPVRDIDEQIRSLEAMQASGRAIGEKEHKIGVNPIYQQLLTDKLTLEAEIAATSGRRAQLQAQADQVTTKLQALVGIEAEYNSLSTERNALQTNIATFTQRIQETQAAQEIAEKSQDTVRVVNRARPPDKAKSLKKPVLILAFLFGGFTALCAGLLRVFLRKGFSSAEMASKTLDLPVLAQAKTK
ncbi:Wzz/FepE/Etk N-terminal domain-containing protein [Asticcacaulis sp. BYS171W]|uniref:Wzz/FepE/Etk N-terminal domain-containing protein n=1 Tax=Asticcacaulis aquaticus TaxID=2984212 RepID=A0ABT5HX98_9CAUL|nr:Wzz/FepE/Etk N-terminal domain-containing protein [Asticcacaulis aquaticus]MDC7684706.1 Wzz/FepE/Etk N-terminal domain-containing protein [Asticcacaulis aquaticus]